MGETQAVIVGENFLVMNGDEQTPTAFLAGLNVSDVVVVGGALDAASRTTAAIVERPEAVTPGPGNGRKNKVRGYVRAVARSSFELEITTIKIGGRGLGSRIDVQTNGSKLKYIPRYGRHRGHAGGPALTVGMYVEVEWHGALDQSGAPVFA